MNNYHHSKVYKIVDNTNGNVYVGSTTRKYLSQRLQNHIKAYKQYLNGKHKFMSSFDIIKNNDYNIILLEELSCESRDELNKRERYYFESLDCINKNYPSRTKKEYYDANKERKHQYYLENKEHIIKEKKEYRAKNKEQIYEKRKVYNEQHKERIKEYHKQYHEKRKALSDHLV